MAIKLDTIEGFRPTNNHVLIKSDRSREDILGRIATLKSGIAIATEYDPDKHSVTSGEVVAVPDRLNYGYGNIDYKTDMEICKGDKAIFYYLSSSRAMQDEQYVDDGVNLYFLVKYDEIFCVVRNVKTTERLKVGYQITTETIYKSEVIPINGFILVEPTTEEQPKSTLIIPDYIKRKTSETRGIVRHISTPLKGYKFFPDEQDTDELQVGDMVMFASYNAIPLQYSLYAELSGGLIRCQRRDILCKLVKDTNDVAI